jgi:hypothetical protein
MARIPSFGQTGGSIDNALQTLHKRRIKKRTVQEALTGWTWVKDVQGALTVRDIVIFYNFGPSYLVLSYILRLRTHIFGNSPPVSNTWQNLHMRVFFLAPHFLAPMNGSGKHGDNPSAVSFCDWLHIISAGL